MDGSLEGRGVGWLQGRISGHLHDRHSRRALGVAAARVCHPIFHGVETGAPLFGVFLKDYVECEWQAPFYSHTAYAG